MTSITLIVTGANIRAEVNGILTSGMVGIPVSIQYDEAWNGLTKNLVCRCGKWDPASDDTRSILNVGETAVVAHEIMQPKNILYLGIEGFSADGSLVIPTMWVNCGYIHPGAITGSDTSATPALPVWAQLQAMIGDLAKLETEAKANLVEAINEAAKSGNAEITIPDLGGNTGGLSETAKTLLITILRNAVYSSDQSAVITALEAALASGSSSGGEVDPDEPGGGDEPNEPGGGDEPDEPVYYTVANILTNVASSNAAGSVAENAGYTATLTAEDSYEISAVTVLMGGVDVTDTVYANGVISIPAVTGNVVITATAIAASTGNAKHYMSQYNSQLGYYNVTTGKIMPASSTYYTEDIPVVGGSRIEIFATTNVIVAFKSENGSVITPVTSESDTTQNNRAVEVKVPDNATAMSIMYASGKSNIAYWMYLD